MCICAKKRQVLEQCREALSGTLINKRSAKLLCTWRSSFFTSQHQHMEYGITRFLETAVLEQLVFKVYYFFLNREVQTEKISLSASINFRFTNSSILRLPIKWRTALGVGGTPVVCPETFFGGSYGNSAPNYRKSFGPNFGNGGRRPQPHPPLGHAIGGNLPLEMSAF